MESRSARSLQTIHKRANKDARVCVGGGFLGVVLGIGILSKKLSAPGLFSFGSINYFELLVIMMVTFITGVLSGVFPARQVSRLEPAEALHYE